MSPLIKPLKQGLLAMILVELLLLPSLAVAQCDTAITATTAHLIDNHNGTISDPKTGLIWKKCSVGQSYNSTTNSCDGTATKYTWQLALQQSDSVWRIPNIKELSSIVELSCSSPSINEAVFPETPLDFYWSSSPLAFYSNHAWVVRFNNYGEDNTRSRNENGDGYVRLVRSGR